MKSANDRLVSSGSAAFLQRCHRAMANASLGVRPRVYFWKTFRAGSRGSASCTFWIMSARMSLGRSSYVITR
eukprot:scaffold32265_cov129-Isochrysis_galbana.AAC.2